MMTSWTPVPSIHSKMPRACLPVDVPRLRAGNLLGTTRTRQPGASAAVPASLRAKTSGGVLPSLPSQNGQKPRASGAGTAAGPAGRKSSGRLLRSVAMMTQRPLMRSFLSSDIIPR